MIRCTRNIISVYSFHHKFANNLNLFRNNRARFKATFVSSQKRHEHNSKKVLGHTNLLFQDGTDLQELPLIVKMATDLDLIQLNDTGEKKPLKRVATEKLTTIQELLDWAETFSHCDTIKRVFQLMETIPSDELKPLAAVFALQKVVKIETDNDFMNKFKNDFKNLLSLIEGHEDEGWFDDEDLHDDEGLHDDEFNKLSIVNIATDIIIKNGTAYDLIGGLSLIKQLPGKKIQCQQQKFCDEILIQISDGKFSIAQICEAAKLLLTCACKGGQDKVWVGLVEKEKEIDSSNIMDVFRILPILKVSRNLVLNILQRRLEDQWFKIQGKDMAEILSILKEIRKPPERIIKCLAGNIKMNLHALKENEMFLIVQRLTDLNSSETDIEKVLERYMKFRKSRIQNPELMSVIMNYCKKFRVRSSMIFNGCSDFFIRNAYDLSPVHLSPLILPFGYLNIQPVRSSNFWETLEEVLSDKFSQLCPEDALDIMLSYVYLEKYPVHFINKLFNPFFLDRLHALKDQNLVQFMRSKLKLLDTALTLECDSYSGPLLPPDLTNHPIKQDGRIERITGCVKRALVNLYGSPECVSSGVVLKNLPLTELYIVDLIAHPRSTPTFSDYREASDSCTAFLIHLPEHYDSNGEHLIGPQVMRKRHLRCIGLNVVDLHYFTVATLKHHEKHLEEYLKHQILNSEEV